MAKVIFLAIANSRDQQMRLPSLERESDELFSILVDRSLKGDYQLYREEFITIELLNKRLAELGDDLVIFHYAGHANRDALLINDQESSALGLVQQLKRSAQKQLKMVVMNGCNTKWQAEQISDIGVPIVVGTSAPVGDESAVEFALRFYKRLVVDRTSVEEALENALGAANSSRNEPISLYRRIGPSEPTSLNRNELWSVFGKDEDLGSNPVPVGFLPYSNNNYVPNEKLTEVLLQALAAANCESVLEVQAKAKRGKADISDKRIAIVNSMPYPVVAHLQKVLAPVASKGFDKISFNRLKQIGLIFQSTLELLGITMLAQIWELVLEGKLEGQIDNELKEQIRSYCSCTKEERGVFDYIPLIRTCRQFIDSQTEEEENNYFVEELHQLVPLYYQKNSAFFEACEYLKLLRHLTYGDKVIPEVDLNQRCQQAEDKLCDFFLELGFLHRYPMVSVQGIDIRKLRHQKSEDSRFQHQIFRLMRAIGAPDLQQYRMEQHLDNQGVILLKSELEFDEVSGVFVGEVLDFLNLSPFYIDINAFDKNTDLTNLYSFTAMIQEPQKGFIYESVRATDHKKERMEITNSKAYEAIYLQMEAYEATFLN